jgi:hypothetical protein
LLWQITGQHETQIPEKGVSVSAITINPDPPSITQSWGNSEALYIAAVGLNVVRTISSYPTNYTNGQADSAGSGVFVAAAERILTGVSGEDPGIFTLNSSASGLAQTFVIRAAPSGDILDAEQGSYSITGYDAAVRAARVIVSDQGFYTLTGQPAVTRADRRLIAASTNYSMVGQAARVAPGKYLVAGQGAYSMVGQASLNVMTHVIRATTALYSITLQNLLAGPSAFDSASWVKINTVATANVELAPNGSLTADNIAEDTSNTEHYVNQILSFLSSSVIRQWVDLKPAGRRYASLRLFSNPTTGTHAFSAFDTVLGTVVDTSATGGATILDSGAIPLPNGWFRIYQTVLIGGSDSSLICRFSLLDGPSNGNNVYTGDGVSGFNVSDMHVEQDNTILAVGHMLKAGFGSYALVGQAASLMGGKFVTAGQGSYLITGQAAIVAFAHMLTANPGAYSIAGQPSILAWAHKLIASQGAYSIIGKAAIEAYGRHLVANPGAYVIVGQDQLLREARRRITVAVVMI